MIIPDLCSAKRESDSSPRHLSTFGRVIHGEDWITSIQRSRSSLWWRNEGTELRSLKADYQLDCREPGDGWRTCNQHWATWYNARVQHRGDIAQLGERGVRNAEVGGSSPPISTMSPSLGQRVSPRIAISRLARPHQFYLGVNVVTTSSFTVTV